MTGFTKMWSAMRKEYTPEEIVAKRQAIMVPNRAIQA
jgi:hypothetical protein